MLPRREENAVKAEELIPVKKEEEVKAVALIPVRGGDNFLNKWNVPLIPCSKLVTVNKDQYEELFDTVDEACIADELDADSCQQTADELVLGKEDVVPFPHEYDMALGVGMIDTFACDILIAIYPGSGEMFKAVLSKQKHGVAICATKAQKTLVDSANGSIA